jgi:hypothetical protein
MGVDMKIRQGFVSNSSSSSFVLIMKKDDYEESLKTLNKLEKIAIDHLGYQSKKAFGHDLIVIGCCTGNDSSFEYDSPSISNLTEDEEDIIDNQGWDDIADKAMDKMVEKYEYITHSIDM